MDELLTAAEHRALDLTGQLAGLFGEIVGDESSRYGDLAEVVSAIHILQRYIMSQAAARAYPGLYRLLGEHIDTSATTPARAGPEERIHHAPG